MNNISLVKRFFEEVFNQRKTDIIYEVISPDCINHYEHEDVKGPKEWEEKFQRMFFIAFPDVHTKIVDIIADDDTVVVRWKAKGKFAYTFFDIQPTGKNIEYNGISWIKIKNGKSIESWNSWNLSFLFRELISEVKTLRGILPICSF